MTGANRKQVLIRELIETESIKLINIVENKIQNQTKKCLELTNPDKHFDPKMSRIDPLLYSDKNIRKVDTSTRRCLVTRLDISMQKEDSRFLCSSGLKYYKKNHPEIWLEFWQRLHSRWHGCSEAVEFREIHHSIRNEYFNKIHNTRRSIEKLTRDPALFDQKALIRKDKLIIAGLAS